MQKMTMKAALKKAHEGYFEFMGDAKCGVNFIKYQTGTGKWKQKMIEVTCTRRR
jgi:hypothetical protein